MKVVSQSDRCGKTAKQEMIDEVLKKLGGYHYYHDSYSSLFQEALNQERMYRENCSDFPKDLSAEATNRRIRNYMERNRNKK